MFFKNTKISSANNFDFLRFVFARTVVCAHIVVLAQQQRLMWLRPFFDTYIAICGFFVISGFLVTKSFMSSRDTGVYFLKRAKRLLPAYTCVIVLCVLLLSLVSTLPPAAYFTDIRTLKYLLANMTFMNFLHPTLPGVFTHHEVPAVDGALWTIKVEVGFYILLPFVVYFTNKLNSFKRGLAFLVVLYAASVLFRQLFIYLGTQNGNPLLIELSHQLPAFLSYFLSGAILFVCYSFFLRHKQVIFWIALSVFLIERYFDWEVLRPMALACMVVYVAFSFPFLNKFGKYGDVSYGIYIFHFPIVQVLIYLGFYDEHPYAAFFSTLIGVCGVGLLSWHLVEKRFLSRKRRHV